MDKIVKVQDINLAFAKMKLINLNGMQLSEIVKKDFQQFINTLRECKNNCQK